MSFPLSSGINSGSGDTNDLNKTLSTTTTTTEAATTIATTTKIAATTTTSFYDTTIIKPTVTPIKCKSYGQMYAYNIIHKSIN